ncbi:ABC-2 family transporter protein [Streptomyces sp. DW26H14]|uniref:ABC-2 family transporter protein n=1 Tax=Streptomyces sp. DW26H14 TaxID=3435395 RepID=UPI00403D5E87
MAEDGGTAAALDTYGNVEGREDREHRETGENPEDHENREGREDRLPGAAGPWRLVREGARAYWLIAAMAVKSQLAYRLSFATTAFANLAATVFDFVTILLMFSQVHALGGFSLPEVAFLYGTSSTAFGLTDLAMGSTERIGTRVRDGTFDVLLLRPVPVLAQVAADRFVLRRLGRIVQALAVLGYALCATSVDWDAARVALMPLMVVSGALIFCAVFVVGAAFQFWAQDSAQVQNAFTYGGTTLLQYPPGLFAKDLVRGAVFVVPLAFVSWIPALYVLGRPLPLGLPGWVAFLSPAVAAVCCGLAAAVWRLALRSYRSTGS